MMAQLSFIGMRRLVVEWSLKDASCMMQQQLEKAKAENRSLETIAEMQRQGSQLLEMLTKIKSFEMPHILRLDEEGFAAIIKIELKDPSFNIEKLLTEAMQSGINGKLQLLEHENENMYTYFVKGKPSQPNNGVAAKRLSMYPIMFAFRDGKVKFTLLGDNKQVKDFLESAEQLGVNYRIVSLMEAKFSPSSPVSRLTEKQRDALILAFRLGYFDTPRKVSSEQLAEKLGLAHSTLAVHLRRAERRLLAEMLSEQ